MMVLDAVGLVGISDVIRGGAFTPAGGVLGFSENVFYYGRTSHFSLCGVFVFLSHLESGGNLFLS